MVSCSTRSGGHTPHLTCAGTRTRVTAAKKRRFVAWLNFPGRMAHKSTGHSPNTGDSTIRTCATEETHMERVC